MFIDRLIDKIIEKNNPSVAGLDPKIEYVPEFIRKQHASDLKGAAEAILVFNKALIDSLADIIPAVKLQLAYYELYGVEGVRVFYETLNYAKKKNLLVIADGKRNDIGSTAQAYSAAYLGKTEVLGGGNFTVFDADALTVNPYLGFDGIEPFLDDCLKYDKGVFILVKTSNKTSGEFQDLLTESGKKVFEVVAAKVDEWGEGLCGKYGYSSVGAVVGATYPEQARKLRKIMKRTYILVPGYGAQGGSAEDAASNFNSDGLGAVVNASRSIMCAVSQSLWMGKFKENDFALAARAEAIRMRDEINMVLGKK